jgi:hypothetical protein
MWKRGNYGITVAQIFAEILARSVPVRIPKLPHVEGGDLEVFEIRSAHHMPARHADCHQQCSRGNRAHIHPLRK